MKLGIKETFEVKTEEQDTKGSSTLELKISDKLLDTAFKPMIDSSQGTCIHQSRSIQPC